MAGATGKRLLLLFPLLAGLFLMHGLSGGGAETAGCHGMPPAAMAMTSGHGGDGAHGAHSYPGGHDVNVTLTPSHPMSDQAQSGETCVPLRPEGLPGLFLALFLVVATVWWPLLPYGARLIRWHWPHGPPRTGVQILHTLSLSRT